MSVTVHMTTRREFGAHEHAGGVRVPCRTSEGEPCTCQSLGHPMHTLMLVVAVDTPKPGFFVHMPMLREHDAHVHA
ncbi:hypothetical protein HPP92_006521 [Vanilla planifolia]|uniref:Uncharacterized protein n=1 Tax=Vanilla planifolia TaxID=51239 RepID=A0A835RM80_VANPL|nr:hypothetical protein HPP92_006521 [Vanilla planifolia]